MILYREISPDNYLKRFIKYAREKFGGNLVAITIYGSYAWGYFNKKKSDYDIFVIFKDKIPRARREINRKFPKISLQYFCTTEDLINAVRKGHFAVYITLLKSARVLYGGRRYIKFLNQLKKVNFLKELPNVKTIRRKGEYEINVLRKGKGYKAMKWAFPAIRKRLQLLTYIKKRKLIWDMKNVVNTNKELLTDDERAFLMNLDKKIRKRSSSLDKEDKKMCIQILEKLHRVLLKSLK